MKWAIVAGTLEKGFYVTGPFDSEQDADDYAEDAIKRYSPKLDICKVVKLDNPGE
jgi:hypothetical protein